MDDPWVKVKMNNGTRALIDLQAGVTANGIKRVGVYKRSKHSLIKGLLIWNELVQILWM